VLVVTGDVLPNEVKALAEKYYGPIPAKKIKERKPQIEIPQIGTKRIVVKAPAENSEITMAWKVPKIEPSDLNAIDPYALSVLSAILDGHSNSRLNRQMVKDLRLADSVDASYGMTGRGPQLFSIAASPAKGKSLTVIEENIRKILTDIKTRGVSNSELERVKTQLVSAQIYKRDSIFAQAMEIAIAEMNGISWKYLDDMLLNVQKVKSEDIQRVVGKYLVDDSLTVATLDPQAVQKKTTGTQVVPAGMRH
jgi:zinc protease